MPPAVAQHLQFSIIMVLVEAHQLEVEEDMEERTNSSCDRWSFVCAKICEGDMLLCERTRGKGGGEIK
jgi:hypothetical protein